LAIFSVLILLIPIIRIFEYRGKDNYGLKLSKNWIISIIIGELVLLLLAWIDYSRIVQADSANDFYWYNMFVYYRGIFPASPLISKFDSTLSDSTLLIIIYVTALIVDYTILLIFSGLKKKLGG